MLDALHRYLLAIESDASGRCVVLRGSGEHFMAGRDVAVFAAQHGPA
jgi:enoyl-CoA hydratase/carnithine racemase